MKSKIATVTALGCAAICAFATACTGRANALGKPQGVEPLSYAECQTEEFTAFKGKAENFAARFAASAYKDYVGDKNFTVSPVATFSALSLAAECAGGDTRAEILSALGVTYEELKTGYPALYRSLVYESENKSRILDLTNSIWVNEGTTVNTSCIDALSKTYYSYSYSTDFFGDNVNANRAIRHFVKERTRGLIDTDFGLPEDTLFTLITTLYLKTVWNDDGRDLPFTAEEYNFTAKDGSATRKKLLQGYYNGGKAYETEEYSAFYTATSGGFKVKFILPKDGYAVDDVFTAENVEKVNAITDYGAYDEKEGVYYETRCLFPEYKCSYDGDLKPVLKEKFGINRIFTDPLTSDNGCDFSPLTQSRSFCSKIRHVTDLTVDRKGIEGAAVVSVAAGTAGEPHETVYSDFVIDRSFCFIITDWQGVTLFSGVVNNI